MFLFHGYEMEANFKNILLLKNALDDENSEKKKSNIK